MAISNMLHWAGNPSNRFKPVCRPAGNSLDKEMTDGWPSHVLQGILKMESFVIQTRQVNSVNRVCWLHTIGGHNWPHQRLEASHWLSGIERAGDRKLFKTHCLPSSLLSPWVYWLLVGRGRTSIPSCTALQSEPSSQLSSQHNNSTLPHLQSGMCAFL